MMAMRSLDNSNEEKWRLEKDLENCNISSESFKDQEKGDDDEDNDNNEAVLESNDTITEVQEEDNNDDDENNVWWLPEFTVTDLQVSRSSYYVVYSYSICS